jgi:GNAT superfamily N-acetyltransferase
VRAHRASGSATPPTPTSRRSSPCSLTTISDGSASPPSLDRGYGEAFDAIDADPNHRLVVLETEPGDLAGCLQLSFVPHLTFRGGWRAQIEAVRIASDRRGEGLGRVLFDWAIHDARRRGCHLVQLTTNAQRPDALAFYESLGFDATHRGMKLYLQGDVTGR